MITQVLQRFVSIVIHNWEHADVINGTKLDTRTTYRIRELLAKPVTTHHVIDITGDWFVTIKQSGKLIAITAGIHPMDITTALVIH